MRRGWTATLLVAGLCSAGTVVAQSTRGGEGRDVGTRPASAMDGEYLLGEAAAGALLGGIGSWGLAWLGAMVIGPEGGEDPGLEGAVTGFLVGTAIGASAGVHLAARGFGLPASYWEALGGAVAGCLALFAVPLDADVPGFWVTVYGLPILGAVVTSSIGSQSRLRVVAGPGAEGYRLGIGVAF